MVNRAKLEAGVDPLVPLRSLVSLGSCLGIKAQKHRQWFWLDESDDCRVKGLEGLVSGLKTYSHPFLWLQLSPTSHKDGKNPGLWRATETLV